MENQSKRTLTIIRRKTIVSFVDKNWFYLEDANGDVEIACTKCRLLGILKNGGKGTYEIPAGALRLIAVSADGKGIYSPRGFAYDMIILPDDNENVIVSGKRYFRPSEANAFEFD